MSKVTIKSANAGAELEFSEVGNEYLTVTFSSASLSAPHRVWVYTGDCEQLVSLFVEMAENWSGWEGAKTWDAIEGDLSIIAELGLPWHYRGVGTLGDIPLLEAA